MSRVLIAIALTGILGPIARGADNTTTKHTSPFTIILTIENKILTTTLADSATALEPVVNALTSALNEPASTPLPASLAFAYTR